MHRPLAGALAVAALAVIGCSRDAAGPTPPPPPPPPAATHLWSDPRSWPSGELPRAGDALVIPVGTSIILDLSTPPLRSLTIAGELSVDATKDVALTADYISVSGSFSIGSEQTPYRGRATITLTGTVADEGTLGHATKALSVATGGRLELHGAPRVAWTRLAQSAPAGATSITLERATDWQAGDRLVIASTDFDPGQAEEIEVIGVAGATVTLRQALRYSHWGILQTIAGRPLDERAEVGLLTRNLVVRGDDASVTTGFGGHIIVFRGGTAHVEGAQLYLLGQKAKVARYPMHWHVAGDVDGQYARNNSVWKSFNRCITVHGSNAATVDGNVCYDHLGHGYFIEDGAETRNVISGNLGLGSKIPVLGERVLPSDDRPATFWITNPDNTVRGNVAAGSSGFGFWYALPEHPTGLSTNASVWPRRTPLREFSGNVAHSNRNGALMVDNGPEPDGTTKTSSFTPHQDPSSTASPAVIADFRTLTAYKHPDRAVWFRGGPLRLSGSTLADNGIGATFAAFETFLQDAVVIGESGNNATPLPSALPIRGYEFYDGRVGAQRVLFANFQPNARRQASALGYLRQNAFGIAVRNFAEGVQLSNANAVYLEDPRADRDGDKAAAFLDGDGSVTGTAGRHVVANVPIMLDASCAKRAAWNAWVCASPFLQFYTTTAEGAAIAPLVVTRDDATAITLVGTGGATGSTNMTLLARRTYALQYASPVAKPRFYFREMAGTDWVGLIVPYASSQITVYRDYDASRPLTAAATLAELDASAGAKYYYDAVAHQVHLRAQPQSGRDYSVIFIDPR
ncbi:MAG: G8 domain-containing protein [Gemmatimonadaceae bacterium]